MLEHAHNRDRKELSHWQNREAQMRRAFCDSVNVEASSAYARAIDFAVRKVNEIRERV